ncbi:MULTISPECIES: YihY/virulence factor BrkB family protein [unclassified Bacillus (in: firmicutes)]|uniref:YihY/virulence factor BrkB family protein n=1 Tax=unclassified Bacillus (in: firmicutes) TaxID=185979 RepID=UPI0008E4EBC1|nr:MULTISPECIES: YihY/virulence factor BrkB family protein [unclassified Bacillus (in: firmicutes)]SFB08852.1 membrane protein [Bacillus sp. UNCCL13]SFQ86931.1 membrane protein [Bacillus sp. cl95]
MRKMDKSLLKELWARIQGDDLPGLAAQLAYFFLLSLFPLLIFLFTLLPYLPIPQRDILGILSDFAPGEAMDLIEKNLKDVMDNRSGGLLSFGIIGTIWSASNGINAIVRAFNKAYDVEESRSFIVARGTAILLTFGMILVFIVALVLPVFGKEIGLFLFSQFGFSDQFLTIWGLLRWLVSAIILFLIFTGLYWIAPNVKMRCRSAFPGALFATIGWIVVSLGFSFYVGSFGNYSATYGGVGGIIVLMVWLYLSGFIIVLGGEINAFYSDHKKDGC